MNDKTTDLKDVYVSIVDAGGTFHSLTKLCCESRWSNKTSCGRELMVHDKLNGITKGRSFNFLQVELRDKVPISEGTRKLNALHAENIRSRFRRRF